MDILKRYKEAIAEQDAKKKQREQFYEDSARLSSSWCSYNPQFFCEPDPPTADYIQSCIDHGTICCEFVPRDQLLEHIDAILVVLNERCESDLELDAARHSLLLKLYFGILRASIAGDAENVSQALDAIREPNTFFKDSFGANWYPEWDYCLELKSRLLGGSLAQYHPNFKEPREFKAHTADEVRAAFESDFGRRASRQTPQKVNATESRGNSTSAVVAESDQRAALPTQTANPNEDTKSKTRQPTADDLMKAELASNLDEVQGWTAQQWADKLGKAKSTIVDTPTWKSLTLLRQKAKAEKRSDRSQR